jgi:TRAP-type C4-dicarboxylate transport system permease small subunit
MRLYRKPPLLTTWTKRPIWKSAVRLFERGWQWLMFEWRAALRVISRCVGLGLIALCIVYSVSLWNRIISAWSWYSSEAVSKDGTPVYPHATLVNPVVASIGAALLIVAALLQAATARRRHKEQTDADRQRRISAKPPNSWAATRSKPG